jgi:hypothetical protein
MNEHAVLLLASIARANIRCAGMMAENSQRTVCGYAMAYTEEDFYKLIDEEGIGYNSAIAQLFH